MAAAPIQIAKVGNSLEYTKKDGTKEYIPVSEITHVQGIENDMTGDTGRLAELYDYDTMYMVAVQITNDRVLKFDIQDVSNRATWTANSAGLAQAVSDINGFI